MTRLTKISLYELPEIIYNSYKDDKEILEKYHVTPNIPLQKAVEITFGMISNAAKLKKVTNYKVIHNNQPIGYTTIFENNLYSYAIYPKFRKKEILIEWMKEVRKVLGNVFDAMLYSNNERAIKFLERNNMAIVNYNKEKNIVTLTNNV